MHVVSRSKSSNSFEFIEKICAKKKEGKNNKLLNRNGEKADRRRRQ